MELLDQLILPPDAHYLRLLEIFAVVIYSLNLPYVGILLGTTALSMWLTFSHREVPNARFDRFAGELVETFLTNRVAMLMLGVAPLVALPLVYMQWFVGSGAQPLKYIPIAAPLVAVAMLFLVRYQKTFPTRATNRRHYLFGITGVGLLKVAYIGLFASVARLHDPEKWYRVKDILILVLNFNVIWKFVIFMHLAGAVTGVAILFFFFAWPGKNTHSDPEYAAVVRKFGGGITLAFTAAVPVFTLFYVFTTPDVAFDSSVYVLSALVVVVALLLALFALQVVGSEKPRWLGTIMTLMIFIYVLGGTADIRSMAVANQEHARLLVIEDEKRRAEREAELEALLHGGESETLGQDTFNTVCIACHRFDEKLLGPPLQDVLPKYAGNIEGLRTFLASPTKKNPDFPPMPNPGLNPAQIKAVSTYLFEHEGIASEGGGGGH